MITCRDCPEPCQHDPDHQREGAVPQPTTFTCRDCLCPVVLTRSTDQNPLSTKFEMRDDPAIMRNYGRMLVELASVIPDGIICFFVSYSYMDQIVSAWDQMGILNVNQLT